MEAKEKIINTLKDLGQLSTSRIAGSIGIDYNYATQLLNELLSENLVEKIETPNSKYWKLIGEQNA